MTHVTHNGIDFGFTRAIAIASLDVDEDVCNPFAASYELDIEEILIGVQQSGSSHKAMATCRYIIDEEDPPFISFSVNPLVNP